MYYYPEKLKRRTEFILKVKQTLVVDLQPILDVKIYTV